MGLKSPGRQNLIYVEWQIITQEKFMGARIITGYIKRNIVRISEYEFLLVMIPDHGTQGFIQTVKCSQTKAVFIIDNSVQLYEQGIAPGEGRQY